MNKSALFLVFVLFSMQLCQTAWAQNENSDSEGLHINGYIQAQYQHFFIADTIGGSTRSFARFSGGDFASPYSADRFMIRRGRIKISHGSEFTKAVLSFDFTDKGFSVKDVYVQVFDPWAKAISVTAGSFNRPFGYEIERSSQFRESPERSRIVQTLFPNEREVGAKLSFRMPEGGLLHYFGMDAAIVNGNGSAVETDNYKDFIGHVYFDIPENNESNFAAGIGFSYYKGKVEHVSNPSDSSGNRHYLVYRFGENTVNYPIGNEIPDTVISYLGFLPDMELSRIDNNANPIAIDRKYYGVNARLSVKTPFGKSQISTEYIWGVQPSFVYTKYLDEMNTLYNVIHTMSPAGPVMGISYPNYDQPVPYDPSPVSSKYKPHHTIIRNFSGGYFQYVQDILETGHQLVIKYDWYDPNTDVSGKEIKLTYHQNDAQTFTYLSPADVKYSTIGIGWNWMINEHVKIGLHYENVTNENTSLNAYFENANIGQGKYPSPGYLRDIKDDAFTARIQYRF